MTSRFVFALALAAGLSAGVSAALPAPARAAAEASGVPWGAHPGAESGSGDFTVTAAVGLGFLEAHEYVYNPDGSTLSELIWETAALPVASFEAEWRAAPRGAGVAGFGVGLDRGSYMEDYDWMVAGTDQWSERSQHSDTALDRYLTVEIGTRYELLQREHWMAGIAGGFRYTNVKWTARGGDFVYSSNGGFRDQIGSFPDGQKGISYEQRLPSFYLGPTGSAELWGMTLTGSAVGGVTFEASDVDDHWQRNLHFVEDFGPAPYLGLQARLSYPIGPPASLFLGGRYERSFTLKGSTTVTDTTTGDTDVVGGDAAGASFQSLRFDAGLRVRF